MHTSVYYSTVYNSVVNVKVPNRGMDKENYIMCTPGLVFRHKEEIMDATAENHIKGINKGLRQMFHASSYSLILDYVWDHRTTR